MLSIGGEGGWDFDNIWHNYSTCRWGLPKMFSRSYIEGQGYSLAKCTFPAEEEPSSYDRPSVVRPAKACGWTAWRRG